MIRRHVLLATRLYKRNAFVRGFHGTRFDASSVQRTTRLLMDPVKTPLSTMKQEQWDNAMSSILQYLKVDDGEDLDASQLSGTAANGAHRLLMRLLREHEAGTMVARKHTQSLESLLHIMLGTWLSLSRYHSTALCAQKALEVWSQLQKWENRGILETQIDSSVYLRLIDCCLARESVSLAEEAATLLLQARDYVDWKNRETAEILIPRFQSTAAKLADSNPDSVLLESLLDSLSELYETGGVDEDTTLSNNGTAGNLKLRRPLSTFEADAQVRKIIDAINNPSTDLATLKGILEKWEATKPEDYVDGELQKASILFFCKRRDPTEASNRFLSKMKDLDSESFLEVMRELIMAWLGDSSSMAPFRAEELLWRFEIFCDKAETRVDPEIYRVLSRRWLKGESPDYTKSQQMLMKIHSLDMDDLQTLGNVLSQTKSLSPEDSSRIYDAIKSSWKAAEDQTLPLLLHTAGEVFSASKSATQCLDFVKFIIEQNVLPEPSQCVLFAESFAEDPEKVEDLISTLGDAGVKLDAAFYRSVIGVYLENLVGPTALKSQAGRIARVRHHLNRFVSLVQNHEIKSDNEEVFGLIEFALDKIAFNKRERDALKTLDMVEAHFQSSLDGSIKCELPLSCYISVARVLAFKGRNKEVLELFNRVNGYYHAGSHHLKPNAKFYELVMISLEKEGPETVERRYDLLRHLVQEYRRSRDPTLLPTNGMYNSVLKHFAVNAKTDDVARSIELVKEMREILPESLDHAFTVTAAAKVIIRSGGNTVFSRVYELSKIYPNMVKKNRFVLRSLIHACTKASQLEREVALRVALRKYQKLRSMNSANARVNYHLMQVLANNVDYDPEGISRLALKLFQNCCQDGTLTRQIRDKAKKLIDRDDFHSVYTEKFVDGKEPESWSKNAYLKDSDDE